MKILIILILLAMAILGALSGLYLPEFTVALPLVIGVVGFGILRWGMGYFNEASDRDLAIEMANFTIPVSALFLMSHPPAMPEIYKQIGFVVLAVLFGAFLLGMWYFKLKVKTYEVDWAPILVPFFGHMLATTEVWGKSQMIFIGFMGFLLFFFHIGKIRQGPLRFTRQP